MTAILATCRALFERLAPTRDWHIEVHQFRIEARSGEEGQPTPEGMHRDGVDYVLVLLVGRRNIQSGVTSIRGTDGRDLGSFTLAEPCDAAWVDDHRVMHGVTPVEPIDPAEPGSATSWSSPSAARTPDGACLRCDPFAPSCLG